MISSNFQSDLRKCNKNVLENGFPKNLERDIEFGTFCCSFLCSVWHSVCGTFEMIFEMVFEIVFQKRFGKEVHEFCKGSGKIFWGPRDLSSRPAFQGWGDTSRVMSCLLRIRFEWFCGF